MCQAKHCYTYSFLRILKCHGFSHHWWLKERHNPDLETVPATHTPVRQPCKLMSPLRLWRWKNKTGIQAKTSFAENRSTCFRKEKNVSLPGKKKNSYMSQTEKVLMETIIKISNVLKRNVWLVKVKSEEIHSLSFIWLFFMGKPCFGFKIHVN